MHFRRRWESSEQCQPEDNEPEALSSRVEILVGQEKKRDDFVNAETRMPG